MFHTAAIKAVGVEVKGRHDPGFLLDFLHGHRLSKYN